MTSGIGALGERIPLLVRVVGSHALPPTTGTEPGSGTPTYYSVANAWIEESENKVISGKPWEEPNASNTRRSTEVVPDSNAVHVHHNHNDKATFWQCSFNLVNGLMGIGLLGLPFVLSKAGWVGGLMCLFLFAVVAWRTAILIGRELNGDPRPLNTFDHDNSHRPHYMTIGLNLSDDLQPNPNSTRTTQQRLRPQLRSFPDIAHAAFGIWGYRLLMILFYLELFAAMGIFFVVIGDHLHQLYPSISARHYAMMSGVLVLVPTIWIKTLSILSYVSRIGLCSTVALVLAIVMAALIEGDGYLKSQYTDSNPPSESLANPWVQNSPVSYHAMWQTSGLTAALGMVAFLFSGHAIIPVIFTSMAEPQDFDKMVSVSFIIVLACSTTIAVSGYYMFGSTVRDQITLSLEEHSQAIVAMNGLIWLILLTAFTKITMIPLTMGLEDILAPHLRNRPSMTNTVLISVKVTMALTALIVAVFVPSFSYLCALVGMTCTMAVTVICPAAAHLALFGTHLPIWEKSLDWLFVILGLVMIGIGTAAAV